MRLAQIVDIEQRKDLRFRLSEDREARAADMQAHREGMAFQQGVQAGAIGILCDQEEETPIRAN